MIKFTAYLDGNRTLIGIGLSEGNIEHLKAGHPIHVHAQELGLPWKAEIMIMYGETETSMERQLAEFITPQTTVHRSSERKPQ